MTTDEGTEMAEPDFEALRAERIEGLAVPPETSDDRILRRALSIPMPIEEIDMSRARTQAEHAAINARHYPGTRQMCIRCGEPTDRCEEDDLYTDYGIGPLCPGCLHILEPYTGD